MLLYNFSTKTNFFDEFDNCLFEYDFKYSDCFCGEGKYKIISLKTRTGQNFTTVSCKKCGTLRINPYLSDSSIDKYYKNLYGRVKRGDIAPQLLHNNQKQSSQRIYDFLKNNINSNFKILDFGGGAGGKTIKFLENKYNCFISDSDKKYQDYAISLGFNEFNPNEKYELITLIHVLEHITNPNGFLLYLKKILNTNGLLYIEIPYLGGKDYNFSIIDEIHIAHKWYFTKFSLIYLMLKNGFEIVKENDEFGGILFRISNHKIDELNIDSLLIKAKNSTRKAIFVALLVKLKRIILKKIIKLKK